MQASNVADTGGGGNFLNMLSQKISGLLCLVTRCPVVAGHRWEHETQQLLNKFADRLEKVFYDSMNKMSALRRRIWQDSWEIVTGNRRNKPH